jgi:hypothetical protein
VATDKDVIGARGRRKSLRQGVVKRRVGRERVGRKSEGQWEINGSKREERGRREMERVVKGWH